ncbi:thermonuclease family protein [Noviherbaspirillum humi]|nr:thermonuclease family protein [Noviherbaspirillum humi]
MSRIFLVLAGILLSLPVFAHKVIGIADGDTLTLLVDKQPLRIQLANIDAPERGQAFASAALKSLSDLCFGKDAEYRTVDVDKYGRTVAIVSCEGVEANREQVARGMAWVDPRFNQDQTLAVVEEQARKEHRGLWVDPDPVPPWDYRSNRQRGRHND